jgi:hypothetical protein
MKNHMFGKSDNATSEALSARFAKLFSYGDEERGAADELLLREESLVAGQSEILRAPNAIGIGIPGDHLPGIVIGQSFLPQCGDQFG